MPIYKVEAPDGNIYRVEGPEGATLDQLSSALSSQVPESATPFVKESGVFAGVKKGIEQLVSQGQTVAGVATGDANEAAKAALARSKAMDQKYADQVSLQKIKDAYNKDGLLSAAGETASQIPLAIAEQLPNFGASFAGAKAGAMAGQKAGSIFGARGRAIGAIGGGIAGTFAPSYIQSLGGNVERQAQEQEKAEKPINIDTTGAALTAVPQAALDVVSDRILLGGKMFAKMVGIPEKLLMKGGSEGLEKLAKERLMTTIAKGTATGIAGEVPTEVTQQALERYQAGLSLTDEDAFKEYGETMYQVALLGPLGIAGRLSKKGAARADIRQTALEKQRADAAAAAAPKPPDITDPAYLQQIQAQYQEAEQRKADLRSQLRKVEDGSVTETADRLHNKEIEDQIKAMTPELEQLAAEYNKASKVAPAFTPEAVPGIFEIPKAVKTPEAPKQTLTVGDALDNPLGRFTRVELSSRSPKVVDFIDEQRKKLGKPALNDYSIEDIRDAMPGELPDAEKADLNSLIAAKTGYTPEVIYKPEDIINVAKQKNIATDTDGFKFFLQRATGDNDVTKMEQPQLHSAFTALSALPEFDETQYLPEKTNATHYSPQQYRSAVEQVSGLASEKDIPSAQALQVAKKATGLTRDSDVQLLLQNAYTNGDLNLSSKGDFITAQPAEQAEFKVEEGFAKAQPTGFNVMRGDQLLYSTQNEDEAKAKIESLSKTADPAMKQINKSIANERNTVAASQRSLDIMEAAGLFRTPKYQQASAQHAALVQKSNESIGRLQEKMSYLQQPVTIRTTGKPSNVKVYRSKEQGVSSKEFNTREEALKHILENLPAARLNDLAGKTKSPGFAKRLQGELERRKNPLKPFIAFKPKETKQETKQETPTEKPETTAQKEAIKSQLLPMLKKFGLGDVALKIEEGMEDEGSYAASLIKVALDANNPVRVLRHESVHGLKDLGFFTPGQWKVLENQADKVWIDKYLKQRNINGQPLEEGQQSRYEAYQNLYDGDMEAIREEAIADAFGDFDINGAPKGLFATLLKKMQDFFRALRSAFTGAGYETADDVFGKVERGELSAGNKAGETEKQSLTSGNAFDKAEVAKAKAYGEKNGIAPYLSVGRQYLPTTGGEKYSLKTKDKYGMYEGIPLNNDGTITVYYHTTKANAMDINKAKRISPSDDKRVYLTNESSGALVLKNKGLLPQETDGSVVMLKLPPEMMQFAEKYSDGRVDMFIPLAEGNFFDKKMRVSAIQVSKNKAILEKGQTFSYKDHAARISGSLTAYEGMSAKGKKQAVKRAAEVLREQHNIGTLLTTNGKLEKTSPEAEGLSDLDVNASSMGLGLASAQKITEKLSSCPNSAICVDLCLGDTAGGNQQYGGVAKEDVGDIEKSAFRAGPRMVQYLKTEALIIHPEEFALVLSNEIQKFKKYERSTTIKQKNPKAGKMEMVEAEVYEPSIRLNVTSDFAPEMFKPLFDAHPDVVFYDYTKLQGKPIAENHHLTYSSTGFAQMIDGKLVQHKTNNWNAMRGKLNSGYNVAMAFTSKSALPKTVMDEETGKAYQVWDGDNYDARYLDPKRPDGIGMIVGLRNKAGTMRERESAAQTDGFFANYNPKVDGDEVVVPDQKQLTGRKVIPIAVKKLSLRTAPDTPEFKRWFKDSKVVDENGQPIVMYHGTPYDFVSGKSTAIFNTKDFGALLGKGAYFTADPTDAEQYAGKAAYGGKPNIIPTYVSLQNPYIAKSVLEKPPNQKDLSAKGYDGILLKNTDGSVKWAVAFEPTQVKSAIGNTGAYDPTNPDIRYSLRTAPDTPEFKRFFGDSKVVDANGEPKLMYHGTAKDIGSFKRKTDRGVPIFLTDDPTFAEKFSKDSMAWMTAHPDQFLTEAQIKEGQARAIVAIRKDFKQDTQAKEMIDSLKSGKYGDATAEAQEYLRKAYKNMMPSGPNIVAAYVKAENPFDYQNPEHVKDVLDEVGRYFGGIASGNWEEIESKKVQDAIKKLGFDSFYVQEDGRKNLAVYDSSQIKSATGNVGAYGQRPVTKEEAARSGMTEEEAQQAQAEGDIRYSLRTDVSQDIRNMPNGAAIEAAIDRVTTARQEVGYVERMTEALAPKSWSYLRQKVVDRYNRLADFEKLVAQQMGGVGRLADENAHASALQSDAAAGVAASALGVGNRIGGMPVYRNGYTTVSNENGTVKGAVEIFSPLAKKGDPRIYQAYQFWAGAKRGKRLLASGKEHVYTLQDMALAKQLKQQYPEFVDVQKDWVKYNDGLVKYAVDTGQISAKNAEEFTRYSDYVPFYRQIEGDHTVGPNIFQSISGVKAPKKLTGSEAPLADFLETIVRNTQSIIQAGMKNVAAQKAVDGGVRLQMVRKMDHISSGPNVVTVLQNGQKVSYECADKLWVDAVSSLNLPELPFLNFLAMPANFLRAAVTKDPGFMLANLMRDSLSAYITSGAKLTPIASTVKEMGNVLMGNSPEYQKLLSAGVLGGYEFSRNVEASTKAFAADLRKKTGTKTNFENAISPFKFFWDKLEKGTEASDAATRIAIYKATLAETGNEAEAIHRALEVMNFNRKGSSAVIRIVAATIPFLNARIQGLDVFFRAGIRPFMDANATEQEKQVQRAMIIRGVTMLGLSVMYAAAISGNPDYEKQEEETKDNNWIIPMGEGKNPLKIPIPFEVGTLFKTIPERIYRSFFMSNKENRDTTDDLQKSIRRAIQSTFAINPVPQFAAPLLEARDNYSVFTQRNIVGQNMQGIAPEFQVGPGTSKWAEILGKQSGMSPMMLDHVYKGYTGTMGVYAADLLDAGINAVSPSDVEKPSKRIEQMPIIKRFLADPEARGQITAYYDLKHSVDTTVRTINLLEKDNNPSLPDYFEKNAQLYAARDFINNLNQQMDDLQKQANMIRAAAIPADEKRDMLSEVTKAQNLLVSNIRQVRHLLKP